MRGLSWMFAGLLLIMSGCSGLILRDTDSPAETTGKVVSRIILCPITICISEIGVAEAKQQEWRQEAQRQDNERFSHMTPEQQERELNRQSYERIAALQGLGFALSGGGPFHYQSQRQTFQPAPLMNQMRPRNCMSQMNGGIMMTQCY